MNTFKHPALISVCALFSLVGLADARSLPVDRSAVTHAPKFEVDQALFPFDSRFMILNNGARIHYIDEGKGPVLLLLHGNPTWSFLYHETILLKNAGHFIQEDAPAEISIAIRKWYARF